ncbi:hypothetical protein ACWNMU_09585 [Escherichia fergusonii]
MRPYKISPIIYIYIVLIVFLSKDIFLVNTSDFGRTVDLFLNGVKNFSKDNGLVFGLKDNYKSIAHFEYISSYSYLLYFYAFVTSLYTNILDMRLLGVILKITFIIALYFVFKRLSGRDGKSADSIFIALSLLLMSSSNLSMFNSFYQEQVLLICIPLIIVFMERRDTKGIVLMFTFLAILTTSKSQFALTPIIFILYQIIFDRYKIKLKLSLSLLCLLLGVLCISFSKGAVSLNKYHSTYYGIYQLMKNNKIELPENVDHECVGVDAWGNKYDIAKGALSSDAGQVCYKKNLDTSFSDTIKAFFGNPSLLFTLPYDLGMKEQYTENYIHVFKSFHLIENNHGPLAMITNVKDYLFKNVRFSVLFISLILSLFLKNEYYRQVIFFISSFGVSQLFLAFLGEGYRDLSKHLFGMNISFDLLIFTAFCMLLKMKKRLY